MFFEMWVKQPQWLWFIESNEIVEENKNIKIWPENTAEKLG